MTTALLGFAHWITTAPGLAPMFVSAGLKATALLMLGWMASLLLRRSSASMRHVVWSVVVAGSLALLVLLPVMPRWPLLVLPSDTVTRPAVVTTQGADDPGRVSAPLPGLNDADGEVGEDAASPLAGTFPRWRPTLNTLFLVIWAAVANALLLRLALGIVRVRREVSRPAVDEPWLPLARELAERLGVGHRVTFAVGHADAMPMTWGLRRAVVLVPEGAETWPDSRLRTVLLHELAHVRRFDCLTQTLAGASCAIYWFNPLAWLAAGRLVIERERACDDAVLSAGADGGEYAEQLLDVARAMRSHGVLTWASVSMARRSQLEGRLLAILDPTLPRQMPARAAVGILVLCLGVLVPTLAAVQLAPRPEPTPLPFAPDQSAAPAPQVTPQPRSMQAVPPPAPRPMPTPMPMPMPAPTPGAAAGRGAGHTERRQPVEQKVIDALTTALKDVDLEVREHALVALGQLRDTRATPALVAALSDASADLREGAVRALGQMRDPAALEPVLAALKDPVAAVREQAAFALGQMHDSRAVAALLPAVADANADVREQAAFALGELRDKRATPALVTALADMDVDVREQAAFALGQLRDPAAAPALARLMTDKDAQVREQAVFALGQLRDPAAVDGLLAALKDSSADVQEQAAFALGQVRDTRAVDALISALSNASPDVREHAAFALGQIRDPRATDPLMAAMKDADADVRKAAAFALSQVIGREQ